MLRGTLAPLPMILGYIAFVDWLFRGKVPRATRIIRPSIHGDSHDGRTDAAPATSGLLADFL